MKYKIKPNFFSIVVILIISSALIREYNSETGTFPKKGLAIVYGFAILSSIIFMIKKKNKQE
jgi:hypothetical protein